MLRFDDLEPGSKQHKRIDHVSLDRFDGSVVEKFDDRPLIGSPDHPLVFSGFFWIHQDFTDTDVLAKGLQDLADGLYPLGGNVGIGYGWLDELGLPAEWLPGSHAGEELHATKLLKPSKTKSIPSPLSWELVAGGIYNPYYYIPPSGDGPDRTTTPTSHATLDPERYTGSITCNLTTISPLLLPDTRHESGVEGKHREFPAFQLNNTVMIPGTSLRAAVSQIYEALTDSCLRVMDQKRTLSWRMTTEDHLGSDRI